MRAPIAVACVALGLVVAGSCAHRHVPTLPLTSATSAPPMPALQLTLLDGAPWTPASAAGKVLLIDVWASWCAPCITGLRRADALAAADPDLAVLGLSLDRDASTMRAFLADVPVRFDIAQVEAAALAAAPLAIRKLPALILVDGAGRIRWLGQETSDADYDAVATAIEALHAEARAPGTVDAGT